MEIIFESMDEFLNENLGVLSKYNLSKPVIDLAVVYQGSRRIGPTSEVEVFKNLNYKTVAAALKPQFGAGFILANGSTQYMLTRESDRKYNVFEISNKISEGRRGGYGPDIPNNYRQAGWMASLSAKGVFELITKLTDAGLDVTLEMVQEDIKREGIRKDRQQASYDNIHTLEKPESEGFGGQSPSGSQRIRNRKVAMKRKVELEKKAGAIAAGVKEDILKKFDTAMDEVMQNLRKGYSWYASGDEIGKKIVKGLDLSTLKNLSEMYKVIEEVGKADSNVQVQELLNKLKKMGL